MEKIQLSDGSDLDTKLDELERRIEALERMSGSVRELSPEDANPTGRAFEKPHKFEKSEKRPGPIGPPVPCDRGV
jgi:hypothetical protein